jgi:hypothetical protein
MHGRRGFEKAFKEGAKSGQSLAAKGLGFYKRLYDLEERAKKECAGKDVPGWPERHEFRQREVRPLWEEFKAWADQSVSQVPPKS